MLLSGFGKRVIDTAKQWGRRTSLPLDTPPVVDAAMALEERAAVPDLSAAERAERYRHREATRALRAARNARSAAAVATFLAEVRHLPLFSGTATQLIRSAGDETVTAGELVRLISTDAALVAHLLRIVNSPFYGFPRRMATVSDALSVLGVDHVRRTVTAAILQRPLMAYLHDSRVVRTFWRHELLCAALARHLAARRHIDGELAYMAGLMHDVGRLAMLMQHPGDADLLLQSRRADDHDDHSALDVEYETYGFDHAQAGGALLERWGLPAPIVRAAHEHVDALEPDNPFSASVWRANRLTQAMDRPDDADIEQPWMIEVGLTVPARRRILDEIRAFESDVA